MLIPKDYMYENFNDGLYKLVGTEMDYFESGPSDFSKSSLSRREDLMRAVIGQPQEYPFMLFQENRFEEEGFKCVRQE